MITRERNLNEESFAGEAEEESAIVSLGLRQVFLSRAALCSVKLA
jgi:hypothetical protein